MNRSVSAKLPIIDFSKIKGPHEPSDVKAIDQTIIEKRRFFQALQEVGFVYLKNLDIDESTVQTVFAHAKRFFSLDESEKAKIETGESKSFHGWFSPARTSANARFSDQKEAFDMGDDNDPTRPNQWPENLPGFREDMNEVFEKCHEAHLILLGALAEAVNLPADYFVPYVDKKHHFFRVIYYPETTIDTFKERVRAATHTDYGTLTLLFNDESGGLQVRGKDGKFFNAPPIPGCAIINVGDLLSRWFNDLLKSTDHRVIEPPVSDTTMTADGKIPARYSIAWFGHPNRDAFIEPLSVCVTAENPKRYTGVYAGKHVVERLAKLHKDGKNSETWADDMQRQSPDLGNSGTGSVMVN